ncbi:GNAT family N-acetyltransferase [Streptomyces nanshensis]|uniref:N-acetyltransferase domain-containing protein n=1 Tax=Streptomyces nanshensis TaxID=518642 RepID=A0A1E7L4D2_9ACTN|nr:GNAT family N-acetyltransferase [Streptomyces nanshensis]OEV11040.1 hypothetical protein AN218_14690 [Streptomyces nanshensis]
MGTDGHAVLTSTPAAGMWDDAAGERRIELHVGKLAAWATILGGETLWVTEIAVHPHHRGEHLASRLLRQILTDHGHVTIGLAARPFIPKRWAELADSLPPLEQRDLTA